MRLKLDIDQHMAARLVEVAVSERRPVAMQAEVLLRQALELPVPVPSPEEINASKGGCIDAGTATP